MLVYMEDTREKEAMSMATAVVKPKNAVRRLSAF
jgi:hypothetical protein